MTKVFEVTWSIIDGSWGYDVWQGDNYITSSEVRFGSYEEAYDNAIANGYKWNGEQN